MEQISNLWTYGDVLGPTYEQLTKKGLTPAQIAISACCTGGADLGLKNNKDEVAVKVLKEVSQNIREYNKYEKDQGKGVKTEKPTPKNSYNIENITDTQLLSESKKQVVKSAGKVVNDKVVAGEGRTNITPKNQTINTNKGMML